ncbi:ParB N-terminal domain-containing protein [Edwardsiella ictaluri]|uniref:ParB N-terminal domain-containing protein n=1 Tax=Edwardsiella ictaluri TaxID=67780 RepID=UPI0021DB710B|nr:ParB N-terminal domain-containing protein [Edwardsiella ictaluri]UYB61005.1 ParB N-terminal domain-containing protein [Edwardsiella ictaluri]UYB64233.1 ParB N-terminal domain-containing protein [Edwardsiella ictaluri]
MNDFDKIIVSIKNFFSQEFLFDEKVAALNLMREALHQVSPFSSEPIDFVLWVKEGVIDKNDYNPNSMASVERRTLETSLNIEGFTQPIITHKQNNNYTIIDGCSRYDIAEKLNHSNNRFNGYVPISIVNQENTDRASRIISSIRHNRARGQHQIMLMSNIVKELYLLGLDDKKISVELGMDRDEVLRLKQINGIVVLFAEDAFSEAWTIK